MDILTGSISAEINVKNSRFLAELFPVTTQADARNKLKEQKNKYEDASHVVHAFICGLGGEVMGMSDDGEPSGTAGRPVLDVLKGHGCTNCMLTVTRWFGGTLLGTGGLVKAYGDSAKAVLVAADDNHLFEEYIEKKEFSFTAPYEIYEKIKRQLINFPVSDVVENFSSVVEVSGKIHANKFDSFACVVKEISNGKVVVASN